MAERLRQIKFLREIWKACYGATIALLYPLSLILARTRKEVKYPNSVLHISNMLRVPYETVRILRGQGIKADYLAVGTSSIWNKADYVIPESTIPFVQAVREFLLFWRVAAKYEVVHLHFIVTLSRSGWELPFLKMMGRKVVVHYRGCEIRDRAENMRLHPAINICQECEYNPRQCETHDRQRGLATRYGDHFLVTTPDMRDFVPEAEHFPFFSPDVDTETFAQPDRPPKQPGDPFKIVHATVHPGIEGTRLIQAAIDRLNVRGFNIQFVFLKLVPHDQIMREFSDADLAIGKMKMGYYANAQIESMFFGVPTITYVRPEFLTDELRASGFIFTTLPELESTIEYYITHPEALAEKRRVARESILRLHDNEQLARRLAALYDRLKRT